MSDRDKVIKGLECCKIPFTKCYNGGCPYFENDGCKARLKGDALALLKAQEPKVMTLDELEDWDGPVFFEAFETDMYYALIEHVEPTAGIDGEFVFVNVVPGSHHRRIWGGEHYGEIWRCWTSRPTEEQREATPWTQINGL